MSTREFAAEPPENITMPAVPLLGAMEICALVRGCRG